MGQQWLDGVSGFELELMMKSRKYFNLKLFCEVYFHSARPTYCRSTTTYWLGLYVANYYACLANQYTWVDNTAFSYTNWQSATCTPALIPPYGPFKCSVAIKASGLWSSYTCKATFTAMCQKSKE